MVLNWLIKSLAVLFLLLLLAGKAFSRDELDFEEFMGMMSETMTDEQLNELSFQVPWFVKILGYGYGDFSGDGKDDIILSIREKDVTPKKTVDVYFFENVDNKTYRLIKKKNYKWFEITLEVAFMVKAGKCYVTNRDDNNWYFTSFEIKGGKLLQVAREKFPIEFENAGN
ncbi:MAG: hypothetical protein L0Y79_12465 [Chlorobi bacterium]|nr:hypothetical protein [Chlorobiota bacterium]MCI0716838.1 hypothetical protein [Chlorobiota bacterium]